jgi:hypothetical protein
MRALGLARPMLTPGCMPAMVDEILAKAGYVRLSKYGLMLTPQGHIISLQPRLPDEGSSARIVGWLEGCEPNGALSLPDQFVNPPKAPAPSVASPVATVRQVPAPPPPPPAAKPAPATAKSAAPAKAAPPPLPGVKPMESEEDEAMWAAALERAKAAAEPVAIAPPPPVKAAPPPVKAAPPRAKATLPPPPPAPVADDLDDEGAGDEGDEWEWQVALARARVAAEEAEAAKHAKPAPTPIALKAQPIVPQPVAAAAKPAAVHIPPKADPLPAPVRERPSMAPRPVRASNTTGWKPPTPPSRRSADEKLHANDQTSPKPKLPLTAEPTKTETRALPLIADPTSTSTRRAPRDTAPPPSSSSDSARLRVARGTESPAAVTTASTPRLTLVSAEPRPLPSPPADDDTHVDLLKVKAASTSSKNDGPSPLPRLSARR